MLSSPHPPKRGFEGSVSLCEMLSGPFPTSVAKAQKNLGVKPIYQTLVNTGEKLNELSISLLSMVQEALWARRESSPPLSHILAPDARFIRLHLLAQPRFDVFEFLFSLENRTISIDADARESEGSAEAGTSTQRNHFPPLLSLSEDQDYNNSTTQPIQDSIKHTVGHTTSSFLTPSRYFTPPSPCKIKSLAPATDGEIDGEAQVEPSLDAC